MIKKLKRLVILIIALYVRPIKSNIYDTFEGNIYFDHSSYLSKKTSDDLHTRCLKTKCEVSSLQCIQTNGILLGISPCSNLYECRMTGDYQGSCMSQDKSTKLTFLYPGDKCTSSKRDTRVCGYGPQICENNVCKGYLQEERCYRHEDCNPHLFCNRITQKCQPTRKVVICSFIRRVMNAHMMMNVVEKLFATFHQRIFLKEAVMNSSQSNQTLHNLYLTL